MLLNRGGLLPGEAVSNIFLKQPLSPVADEYSGIAGVGMKVYYLKIF